MTVDFEVSNNNDGCLSVTEYGEILNVYVADRDGYAEYHLSRVEAAALHAVLTQYLEVKP